MGKGIVDLAIGPQETEGGRMGEGARRGKWKCNVMYDYMDAEMYGMEGERVAGREEGGREGGREEGLTKGGMGE